MNKNKFLLFIVFILILFILHNLFNSDIIIGSFTSVTINYTSNQVISYIYRLSIILDVLLITLILFRVIFTNNNNLIIRIFLNVLLITVCVILIFLIWYEFYYGSTFYYGEIRDKQGLPFSTNNFGIIGSLVFTFLLFFLIKIKCKYNYLYYFGGSFFIIASHYLLYSFIKTIWKLDF